MVYLWIVLLGMKSIIGCKCLFMGRSLLWFPGAVRLVFGVIKGNYRLPLRAQLSLSPCRVHSVKVRVRLEL